ncbi:IS5/IS1182 family transposase, partial [Candidatus Micrarchaeota archaeon]|nr:IS5/IS1182 family transposase [Candidatus Micrarchaeota archaeon]
MSVDEKYIKRGVFLAAPQLFTSWDKELAAMNAGKRGGPFEYPDSLIDFAARVKDYTGIASRVLEGFLLG